MTIELMREEIEVAIKEYVANKVLGYGYGDKYDMKVSQGKTARATVTLTEKEVKVKKDESEI